MRNPSGTAVIVAVVVAAMVSADAMHWEGCDTPFGSIIGVSHGVPAYSNCNSSYTSTDNHWSTHTAAAANRPVYTGLEWQCVEYGRRWLIHRRNVTYGSVVGAADIWALKHATSITDPNVTVVFRGIPNGQIWDHREGKLPIPAEGDLIIYPIQPGGMPFGHVAVIVAVNATHAMVGEQNWSSHLWPNIASNYSRALRYTVESVSLHHKNITLHDTDGYKLDGWKSAML